MLEGKPTIVVSYSGRFLDQIARPVAEGLEPHGFRPLLIGEEPLPAGCESNPNDKVEWYFRNSDMAVFLATPDDLLESGEVQTRQNIVDEHRLGQQLPHLRHKLLVFKASDVKLPSNINPVHERLPFDDPGWIVAKIVEQARAWGVLPVELPPDLERSPQSSEEIAPNDGLLEAEDAGATAQALAALEAVIAKLNGDTGDIGSLRRAELAIAGLAVESDGADTLGVHLANGIFARRHDLRLRRNERLLLVRTYLHHTRDDNVPGVVWLRDLARSDVVALLTALSREGGDAEASAQALTILGKLGAPSQPDQARQLLRPLLVSSDSRLRVAALDYVRNRRDRRLRDLLDEPRLIENERHRASQTAALLDLPRRPSDVMLRYIEDAYIRDASIEQGLLGAASRISRTVVEQAMRSSVREVRRLGLRMATEKRCLSSTTAAELMSTEKSPLLRLHIVRALMASGEAVDFALLARAAQKRDDDDVDFSTFDEQRSIEVDLGLRLTLDSLKAELRWSSVRGASLYEVVGRRDQRWANRHVRRDLANDFARIKNDWRNDLMVEIETEMKAKLGRSLNAQEHDGLIKVVDERWAEWVSEEKLGTFLLRMFRRAALRVLVVHGRPDDVRFARRFATDDDQDIRIEALHLFERFGTAHDAATVLEMVGQLYDDDVRHRAAETALRLAFKKHKLGVLAKLRENHTVCVWAVQRLAEVPDGVRVASKLLRSNNPEVRLAAADVVWDAIKPEAADPLLSFYMSGHHFYNVVRAIDRRLYAPEWLRDALAGDA